MNENGDISEFQELVDPDSIPHPLSGIIYDPATMSMTAQLAAGVELKEVHPSLMYSDPLEAERIALRMNHEITSFVEKSEAVKEQAHQEATQESNQEFTQEPQN